VEALSDRPLRVVQWTTGNVARQSLAAIAERPELELVGVYAHSKEKAGRAVEALAELLGTAVDDVRCEVAMAYLIEVRGHPQVNLRVEVLPQDMTSMSLEDMLAIGSVITAMPVVNAIPAVVAARPGIVTYADLPTQASRHATRP
jgi:hypothetical protein